MEKTFNDRLQRAKVELLEQIFTEEKADFFLGGSRRFGYFNSNSDWDYFVCVSPTQVERFRQIFRGFNEIDPEYLPEAVMQFSGFGFHITLLPPVLFQDLQVEHSKIAEFLDLNLMLKNFLAVSLKKGGSTLYRILRDLIS